MRFTYFATIVNQCEGFQKYIGSCYYGAVEFACNVLFVPCNLTTETPKPICSDICSNFRSACKDQFNVMKDIAQINGFPFIDNCEDTLSHLKSYGYPNLSSEFRDDCLSLSGMYLITQI